MTNQNIFDSSNLSKLPFWDVDLNTLNQEKDILFILEKVFNYGLWSDYKTVFSMYGKERIRKEVVKVTYLKKDVLNFLCLILDLQRSDFLCFTKTQSLPTLWHS